MTAGSSPASQHLVLLVEWTGVTWPDLLPRVQAGHFPALHAVAAAGVSANFPPCSAQPWPLDRSLGLLASAGVVVRAPAAAALPPQDRVEDADLDPQVLRQFPPDEAARPALVRALCELYAVHNESVVELGDPSIQLLVARHDFIPRVDAAYARSPSLPQARRAAFQLLDLLLHDLRHQAGAKAVIVVCSPGLPTRHGFCVHGVPGRPADKIPCLPATDLLPAFIATLLELEVPAGSPLASPVPLDAAWLRPDIVAAGKYGTAAPSLGRFHETVVRNASPSDLIQLAGTFPGIAWATAEICHVASAPGQPGLLAAAAARSDGGILFAAQPGQAAAAGQVLARLQAEPVVHSIAVLFNATEAPAGSLAATVLQAAGFAVTHTLDLWLTEVAVMQERVRAMTWTLGAKWRLRPATAADVALWCQRPEAASLLHSQTGFDADLSWAVELAGRAAGLLLIERLADGRACVNVLAVAEDARAAGGFSLMVAQTAATLPLAGIRQVIFSTDQTRRETIAFARRCRSRHLRQTLRLHLRRSTLPD